MGKLSEEDEAQLEYIRQWYYMKEKEKEEKGHRKRIRKFHLSMAKWHFEKMTKELWYYIKSLFKKAV